MGDGWDQSAGQGRAGQGTGGAAALSLELGAGISAVLVPPRQTSSKGTQLRVGTRQGRCYSQRTRRSRGGGVDPLLTPDLRLAPLLDDCKRVSGHSVTSVTRGMAPLPCVVVNAEDSGGGGRKHLPDLSSPGSPVVSQQDLQGRVWLQLPISVWLHPLFCWDPNTQVAVPAWVCLFHQT